MTTLPDSKMTVTDVGDTKRIDTFIRAGMDNSDDLTDMLATAAAKEGASFYTLETALGLYGFGIREVALKSGVARHRIKKAIAGEYSLTSAEYEKLTAFFTNAVRMKIIITGAR